VIYDHAHLKLMEQKMPNRLPVSFAIILFFVGALIVACTNSGSIVSNSDSATLLAQTAESILTATVGAREATSSAPITATPCIEDAKFVLDVSVPDGTHFEPNAPIHKTWRLRNTGSCIWNNTYLLKFIGGEQMKGDSVIVPQIVEPDQTVDISVDLIAPGTAGAYRGRWRLFAADGTPFGQTVFVDIAVP
jgi:hypothetical protein